MNYEFLLYNDVGSVAKLEISKSTILRNHLTKESFKIEN